jgi:chitin-binding protein
MKKKIVTDAHLTISLSVILLFSSLTAFPHGSMEYPMSRVYNCFKENPENPKSEACKSVVNSQQGTQPLYDWNGISQASANGNHKKLIPDGTLCSANKILYSSLDMPRSDWVMTNIYPNEFNILNFIHYATAVHVTKYFEFYITKESYDPNQPLKWADLEDMPFCKINSPNAVNKRYHLNCPFPNTMPGRHVIYNIWQRSDSPEAFYACIDVNILSY